MKIYGLVGASGTGKSHCAARVADEKNIKYIIDDGLLISGGRIVAGKSAKKEKTKVASVKTAVFVSDDHAFEVSHAIKEANTDSLLILGTSDGMVNKIAKRLGFDGVDEIIRIEDVSSEQDIRLALLQRRSQGRHVIPVPTMELKKDFSGFYLDPLNSLKIAGDKKEIAGDKTVVRPTFSYLGKYTISDYTIYQIVEHVAAHHGGIAKITRFRAENQTGGIHIETDLCVYYGYVIPDLLSSLREKIADELWKMTSLNIDSITLTAKSVIVR